MKEVAGQFCVDFGIQGVFHKLIDIFTGSVCRVKPARPVFEVVCFHRDNISQIRLFVKSSFAIADSERLEELVSVLQVALDGTPSTHIGTPGQSYNETEEENSSDVFVPLVRLHTLHDITRLVAECAPPRERGVICSA